MEKEEIRIEAPLTVGEVTLVPIVRASLNWWQHKGRLSCFGTRQPVSLVVVSSQGRRAFRMDGEEITLDELSKEVPGINEILEKI